MEYVTQPKKYNTRVGVRDTIDNVWLLRILWRERMEKAQIQTDVSLCGADAHNSQYYSYTLHRYSSQ